MLFQQDLLFQVLEACYVARALLVHMVQLLVNVGHASVSEVHVLVSVVHVYELCQFSY